MFFVGLSRLAFFNMRGCVPVSWRSWSFGRACPAVCFWFDTAVGACRFFRFALAFSGRMRYNIPETLKHKGRAQGMAVPCAPMQESRPPTQQVYCAHSSLYPVPYLFSRGKRRGSSFVVCAASGGVGNDSLRRFCCLNGAPFGGRAERGPGGCPIEYIF